MLKITKGQVLSLRVQTSFKIAGWTPPVCYGVVLSEYDLAPGAVPEETLEIVPCFESTGHELRVNHVRVIWESAKAKIGAEHFIDCDCGLARTIPRSWLLQEEGSVSTNSLKQIEAGVKLYL